MASLLRLLPSRAGRVLPTTPINASNNAGSMLKKFSSPIGGNHWNALSTTAGRFFSSQTKHRNIGISAHIDSGKTTLTERILYYSGRINSIHDVRGKDGVGAKMDSMDLEREKGITIQSAATFCEWKDAHINIIDTPGHVDFTIEVERALRVLDGGVLVLCGVSGVQSQSLTVDRQMKRYKVPRVAFVNKLDRTGSNPWKVIGDLRDQLKLNAAAVQIPIGLEGEHVGVVDLIDMKAITFDGDRGENVITTSDIPADLMDLVEEKKTELIENLADADEEIGEQFLMEEIPSADELKAAIRRQTIACNFVPVFMGSAFKNKGVQALLDGVIDYLPEPIEKQNFALDRTKNEEPVPVTGKNEDDLLALAFKLEETPFGQLTYMRIYQGMLKKGGQIVNVNDGKKIKLSRVVRMHSDDMEEISEAGAGEVVAMFGVDCRSMDTFSDGNMDLAMSSMFVPEPVMSLAIKPAKAKMQGNFGKALAKFSKEDPTLRVRVDNDTKETIISGMGELHLEVYIERMKREYSVDIVSGQPNVNYKETISTRTEFDWLHKKQTGGSGQYAKVMGYVEAMTPEEQAELGQVNEFVNECIGTNIPPEYYSSCEKGTDDSMKEGSLVGSEVEGVRVVLQDGASHAVDSSDQAFRTCMAHAVRDAMRKSRPSILEPVMTVDIDIPGEFQGTVIAGINRRMGLINSSDVSDDGSNVKVLAEVPLANMFGYSTELRSNTQGKGEFTMEYLKHSAVPKNVQEELTKKYKEEREAAA
jgi:elongation factor G